MPSRSARGFNPAGVLPRRVERLKVPARSLIGRCVETAGGCGQNLAGTVVVNDGDVVDVGEIEPVFQTLPRFSAVAAAVYGVDLGACPNRVVVEGIEPDARDSRSSDEGTPRPVGWEARASSLPPSSDRKRAPGWVPTRRTLGSRGDCANAQMHMSSAGDGTTSACPSGPCRRTPRSEPAQTTSGSLGWLDIDQIRHSA